VVLGPWEHHLGADSAGVPLVVASEALLGGPDLGLEGRGGSTVEGQEGLGRLDGAQRLTEVEREHHQLAHRHDQIWIFGASVEGRRDRLEPRGFGG
jgi:hypothetical protein